MFEAVLNTGRDWRQGMTMEGPGKDSEEYRDVIARCWMSEEDMKNLGVKEGDSVKVTMEDRSIIVLAHRSEYEDVFPGQVFIPMGFYANVLLGEGTTGTGMPNFKGLKVKVEAAPGEEVMEIQSLIKDRILRD